MNRTRTLRRRGMFLMDMIILVPIVAGILTVIFQVSIRSMRVQAMAARSLAMAASRDDFLRRMGDDAADAVSARLEQTDDVAVLTLENRRAESQPSEATSPSQVAYRIRGSHVTRIEQVRAGAPTEYNWDLDPVDVNLKLETIAEKPRIVWLSFVKRPSDDGREQMGPPRVLTVAATIDRGGAR